ncbi:MAG: hypothetical protein HY784_05650, partial [Chloroflexi bacterium]|nr:hypothetical protein [Chloroflexota bacterium]
MAAALKQPGIQDNCNYITDVLANLGGAVDVLNFHFYEDPEVMHYIPEWYTRRMGLAGYSAPVLSNEMGQRGTIAYATTYDHSVDMMRKLTTAASLDILSVIWFATETVGTGVPSPDKVNLFNSDGSRRLAADTFQLVADTLQNRYRIAQILSAGPTIWRYLFQDITDDSFSLEVAWSETSTGVPDTYPTPTGATSATFTDVSNQPVVRDVSGGTVTLPGGDGDRTVYVQFRDDNGEISPITDTITFDGTRPEGAIMVNDGAPATNSTAVTLQLTGNDFTSAPVQMQFSADGVTFGGLELFAATRSYNLTPGDELKTVYVRYQDSAGNYSVVYAASILLDTVAPAGTLIVNSDAAYTNIITTALTLSATETTADLLTTQMQFSNNGDSYGALEPFSPGKVWPLSPGDGLKTVYARYRDQAGNFSAPITDTITYDATAPVGTLLVNNDDTYTTSRNVLLKMTASEATSPPVTMQFSDDGVVFTDPEPFALNRAYTLPAGDGNKTVFVAFTDQAGNVGVTFDKIVLDTTPPGGTIFINSDAAYTNLITVGLSLSTTEATSLPVTMQFSNDGTNWSAYEPFSLGKIWVLPAGDGAKTVFVRYKDGAGLVGSAVSDSITLDATAPVGTILINNNDATTTSRNVTLTLTASETGSPPVTMAFSNDGVTFSPAEPFAATKVWVLSSGDGLKTVFVAYTDQAGNSSVAFDKITLSETPPEGSIVINSDATYTNLITVALALSTTETVLPITMQFSNDGANWTEFEPFALTRIWQLSAGDGGKAVYVRYKNGAGLISDPFSDDIVLDSTPPTGSVLIDGGADYTASQAVELYLTASDAIANPQSITMAFSNDGVNFTTPEPFAASKSYTLPPGDGFKTVFVAYTDQASNTGVVADFIILSTASPEGTLLINSGVAFTNLTTVLLSVTTTDTTLPLQMQFANDGVNWSTLEPFAFNKVWELAAGDGLKTVSFRIENGVGAVSDPITATITLDTVAPTGAILVNN